MFKRLKKTFYWKIHFPEVEMHKAQEHVEKTSM